MNEKDVNVIEFAAEIEELETKVAPSTLANPAAGQEGVQD